MIKVFIFDMGGVVKKEINFIGKLSKYLECNENRFRDNPKIQDSLFDLVEGKITEQKFWSIYQNEYNLTKDTTNLLLKIYNPPEIEGTVNLIQNLRNKNYRVVCGTNTLISHYNFHKEQGDYDCFDKIYASPIIHIAKPKIEFFDYICKKEAVNPKEALFIDDRQINIDSAKDYGLNVIRFDNLEQVTKEIFINLNIN